MVPRKIFLQTVVYGDDHTVFCADFSDNMLASVRDVIETEKIQSITLHKLCWQEDWDKHDLPVSDMAFASRCMFGIDPDESVVKLSGRAKRKVCITLPVNASMFQEPGSPYSLGSTDEMNAFADACIDAAKRIGFQPDCKYMSSLGRDESRWLFISWEVFKGQPAPADLQAKSD